MKGKQVFTLIEIVIAVIIIGIIATFAVPVFENIKENAYFKTDTVNLEVILAASEAYALETDEIPATISKLNKYLEKAFAQVMKHHNPWEIRIAYALSNMENIGVAFAANKTLYPRYIKDIANITSPAGKDRDESSGEDVSYGINAEIAGKSINDDVYKAFKAKNGIMFATAKQKCFTQIHNRYRHRDATAGVCIGEQTVAIHIPPGGNANPDTASYTVIQLGLGGLNTTLIRGKRTHL